MARGDYGRSIRASSRDEVGELARAFTQMASELAEFDRRRREFVANVDAASFLSAAVTQAHIAHPAVQFVIDADVCGDRDRLYQVVANLLDNAARHGPSDGTVTITARRMTISGGVVLEISDEGPGIPPDERRHVFERFYRGSSLSTDGGTGLGLAIARWAIELHGGDIGVADSPRGCCIRVVIPPATPML
jgi:signal transduction histidine kinase